MDKRNPTRSEPSRQRLASYFPAVAAAFLLSVPATPESATIPFPRRLNPPVLLAIPSANVLGHGQYMLSGRFQYFNSSLPGDTAVNPDAKAVESSMITYNSELLLGIENRAEFGVQYGKELAFSLKALLVREDIFWPDLVFGVRSVFGTPEGGLYGLEEDSALSALHGESYATLAKTFPSGSRVHAGISYLSGANKGLATVNLGLEQDLGAGAWLGYEVFERYSDFHQVLSLNWRYKNFLALSIGLTEFQSWVRQDGEWGFFLNPGTNSPDGYNSPGITFNLQVLGFVPRRQKHTLPERVAILEVRNVELEKRILEMQEALARARLRSGNDSAPGSGPVLDGGSDHRGTLSPEISKRVSGLLASAARLMAQEASDPAEIRTLMTTLVSIGPEGDQALRAVALDTAAGTARVPAVLTMAFSRDTAHAPVLRTLTGDPDARIRREALTALTKVHPKAALEDARRLLQDSDEAVALAAGEAYRMLGGEPLPESAPARPAPPAPTPSKGSPKTAKRAPKAPAPKGVNH